MDGAAGNSSGSVIWSRTAPTADNSSSLEDDVDIDDEALIRAYEKTRKLALTKLQGAETPDTKRKPIKSALKNRTSDHQKSSSNVDDAGFVPSIINQPVLTCRWQVGDRCMAIYDYDGLPYEAEILQISKTSRTCVIRYCGYTEEDEKLLDELAPVAAQSHNPPHCHSQTCYEQRNVTNASAAGSCGTGTSNSNVACGSCGCLPGQSATLQPPHGFILPPPLSPSALPLLQSPSGPSSSTLHCALMSWYMAGFHTGYHQAVTDLRAAKEGKRTDLVGAASSSSPNSGCCAGASGNLQNSGQQNRNITKKPSPV